MLTIAPAYILIAFTGIVLVVGIIGTFKTGLVWWFVGGVVIYIVTFICTIPIHGNAVYEKIAKGVSMEQVTVKGQKKFIAQVEIIYKDGELESIVLVPGTTELKKQ